MEGWDPSYCQVDVGSKTNSNCELSHDLHVLLSSAVTVLSVRQT